MALMSVGEYVLPQVPDTADIPTDETNEVFF